MERFSFKEIGIIALHKLKANGVTMLDSIDTNDYGKFVHIMDSDGYTINFRYCR